MAGGGARNPEVAAEWPHEEWRNHGPGTGTGTGTGTETGSGTATKTGIGTETETETGIGTETGTETGIGTESGTGTENRTGTESASRIGTWSGRPGAQKVSARGIQSGSLPVWDLDLRGVSGRGWALAGVPFSASVS